MTTKSNTRTLSKYDNNHRFFINVKTYETLAEYDGSLYIHKVSEINVEEDNSYHSTLEKDCDLFIPINSYSTYIWLMGHENYEFRSIAGDIFHWHPSEYNKFSNYAGNLYALELSDDTEYTITLNQCDSQYCDKLNAQNIELDMSGDGKLRIVSTSDIQFKFENISAIQYIGKVNMKNATASLAKPRMS